MRKNKYIKEFHEFIAESIKKDNTTEDMAWLYFLLYVYKGKMGIKQWERDTRINGRIFSESMGYWEGEGIVKSIKGMYVIDDIAKADDIVSGYFYREDLKEAMELRYSFIEYDDNDYPVSIIPEELWLRKNKLEKNHERIDNYLIEWFNRESQQALRKVLKVSGIKEFNYINYFNTYFPERIPDENAIELYRGIKTWNYESEYDNKKTYSSWTYDEKEAERFAKYEFTTYSFNGPEYAKEGSVLKTIVRWEDIMIWIGGHEKEVILKNPVEIESMKRIKPGE